MATLAEQTKSSNPERALSVVFGTHNPESCQIIIDNLVKYDLASPVGEETARDGQKKLLRLREDVKGKVFVAQLYGEYVPARLFKQDRSSSVHKS